MTLEQEIKLDAKHAAEKAAKEAAEKAQKKEKLESARKMKSKNIPDDVIVECTGLSLQQVQEL